MTSRGSDPKRSWSAIQPSMQPGTVTVRTSSLNGMSAKPSARSASGSAPDPDRPDAFSANVSLGPFGSSMWTRANRSPPIPHRCGPVTAIAALQAIAASTALPPSDHISIPADVARWSALATMWRGERTVLTGGVEGGISRTLGEDYRCHCPRCSSTERRVSGRSVMIPSTPRSSSRCISSASSIVQTCTCDPCRWALRTKRFVTTGTFHGPDCPAGPGGYLGDSLGRTGDPPDRAGAGRPPAGSCRSAGAAPGARGSS